MTGILGMLVAGLLLSAFFSGSETGFYRASRFRLVLAGLGGDRVARGLLWMTNNPAWFVATTLVGNNLANYLTSLAVVLLTTHVVGRDHLAEVIVPVLFSPVVFVYGELLPKNLFYHAPNALLRRGGPFFLFCSVLFAPVSAVLWLLSRGVRAVVGPAPERVRLTLARKELQQVFAEGQEAGILLPSQWALAQNVFAMGGRPVAEFCRPVGRVVSVRRDASRAEVLRLARRHRMPVMPVTEGRTRQLVGYVRIVDLYLDQGDWHRHVQELVDIAATETYTAALIRLQSAKQQLARVVDEKHKTVGFVFAAELIDPLFRPL